MKALVTSTLVFLGMAWLGLMAIVTFDLVEWREMPQEEDVPVTKPVMRVCLQQGCTKVKKEKEEWKDDPGLFYEATSRYATCQTITSWCNTHSPRQWGNRPA